MVESEKLEDWKKICFMSIVGKFPTFYLAKDNMLRDAAQRKIED